MLNLTLMHLIVKIKRRCSGETSNGFSVSIIWETFLKAHPKYVFPLLSKYRRNGFFLCNFFEGNYSVFSKIVVEPYGKMFSWSLVSFANLLKRQAVATDSSAIIKSGT